MEYFVQITKKGNTSFNKMWTILENNYKNKIHGDDFDEFYSTLIEGMAREIRQFAALKDTSNSEYAVVLREEDKRSNQFASFLAEKWFQKTDTWDDKGAQNIIYKLQHIGDVNVTAESKASEFQSVKFRF